MRCIVCGATILPSRNAKCNKCQAKEDDKHALEAMADHKKSMGVNDKSDPVPNVILTTESSHNLPVETRLGIISAEVVVGMNVFKDALAGVRNLVGGRSGTIQNALRDIRVQVLDELKREASDLGADAVVGVDLDYLDVGATGSTMLVAIATGTAVKLQAEQSAPG